MGHWATLYKSVKFDIIIIYHSLCLLGSTRRRSVILWPGSSWSGTYRKASVSPRIPGRRSTATDYPIPGCCRGPRIPWPRCWIRGHRLRLPLTSWFLQFSPDRWRLGRRALFPPVNMSPTALHGIERPDTMIYKLIGGIVLKHWHRYHTMSDTLFECTILFSN